MQTILDLLAIILLAFVPATFNYFLDYCFGHPMSDKVSDKAIFFRYSLFLAKRRVSMQKEKEIVAALAPLLNSDNPDTRAQGKKQLNLSFVAAGRDLFTWEQAFGMCPYCTNFWIASFTALIAYFYFPLTAIDPILLFIMQPIFSHTILRKL